MAAPEWIYDITFNEGDNLGGARTIRFAFVQDILVLPEGIQWHVSEEAEFVAGGKWWAVRCVEDSADFTERQRPPGKEALKWDSVFRADIASDRGDIRASLDGTTRYPIIAEVTDNNGLVRRMGELNNPAWMTVEYGTGSGTAALNAWSITVEWASANACYWVTPGYERAVLPYDDGEASASDSGAVDPEEEEG
jgi:hypothetical protein